MDMGPPKVRFITPNADAPDDPTNPDAHRAITSLRLWGESENSWELVMTLDELRHLAPYMRSVLRDAEQSFNEARSERAS